MDMERIIALYMDDCHSRQLRPKTMQSYEQALKLFSTWLEEVHSITQVEAVKDIHIRSYINDLQTRGKYTFCTNRQSEAINHPQNRRDYQEKMSNITINNYLRNMRAFFTWLVSVEYVDRSPMKKIRLLPDERQAREYLEDEEVVRLLKCLDKSFYPEYRDYVLIMLMLDSGTRIGETLSAENTQLDLHDRSLHLPHMSNPTLESTIHEILDLKRMREELDAEINALEDSIKAAMGEEELLTAGAYKVSWKTFTSSRVDTTALKKALPDIAAQFTKQTTARRFSIN